MRLGFAIIDPFFALSFTLYIGGKAEAFRVVQVYKRWAALGISKYYYKFPYNQLYYLGLHIIDFVGIFKYYYKFPSTLRVHENITKGIPAVCLLGITMSHIMLKVVVTTSNHNL
jgi:hypothetical protein